MGINFNGTNLQQLLGKMFGRCHGGQTYNSLRPLFSDLSFFPVFLRKIFVQDRPLILTTNPSAYLSRHPEAKAFAQYEGASPKQLRLAIEQLERGIVPGALISDDTEESLVESLSKRFKHVDAAGGLVRNERGEMLFIFRRGKWDLPKGKLDKGESLDVCAVREVQEETGVKRLVLGDHLCDTWHIYTQGGKEYVKRTAWYAMKASGHETLEPQAEEDIEEVLWVANDKIPKLTLKTYAAIAEVLACEGRLVKVKV